MIPKYDEMVLPLLKYLSDSKAHELNEMREALAEQLGLAEDELRELLPSGRQTVFSPDFP